MLFTYDCKFLSLVVPVTTFKFKFKRRLQTWPSHLHLGAMQMDTDLLLFCLAQQFPKHAHSGGALATPIEGAPGPDFSTLYCT